ncbi:MAG: hypothetical protein M3474_03075 [Actinomycetota bacterium]|nr:hypothetical protein [Actinomycetota bacterium]
MGTAHHPPTLDDSGHRGPDLGARRGVGAGAFGALSDGGFENPDSESAKASEAIAETFGRVDADVLVLYAADGGERVDSPAGERSVTTVVEALPADLVDSVVTPS